MPKPSSLSLLAGAWLAAVVTGFLDPAQLGPEFLVDQLQVLLVGNSLLVGLIVLVFFFMRVQLPFGSAISLGFGLGCVPGVAQSWALGWVGLLLALISPWLGKPKDSPRAAWALLVAAFATLPLAAWLAPAKSMHFSLGEAPPALAATPNDAPDLILISVDTLRADRTLNPKLKSFARLRAEGSWVRAARSPTNQTVPGHASLLTGLSLEEIPVRSNGDLLPEDAITMAQKLRAQGYQTGAVVANGLLRNGSGFERGFDYFDDHLVRWAASGRRFAELVKEATWLGWVVPARAQRWVLSFLQKDLLALQERVALEGSSPAVLASARALVKKFGEENRPYFLFLHFMDPHTAYRPGDHQDAARALPLQWQKRLDPWKRVLPPYLDELESALRKASPGTEEEAAAIAALDWVRRAYDSEVKRIDDALGEVLAFVAETNRPTRLLLTADHGEHLGEHGLLDHANSLYEELLQVPCLLWGVGVTPGEQPFSPTLSQLGNALIAGRLSPPSEISIARDATRLALWDGQWKWRLKIEEGWLRHLGFHSAGGPEEGDLGEERVPESFRRRAEAFLAAEKELGPAAAADATTQGLLHSMGYAGESERP